MAIKRDKKGRFIRAKPKPHYSDTLGFKFEEILHTREMYVKSYSNEKAIQNLEKKKLNKSSYVYKNAFIKTYEDYYKNGGKKRNKYTDELYQKLTSKD